MVVVENLLKRSIAVLIAVSMLVGLLVVVSDDAAALPSDAWITGNVTDGVDPVPNAYVKVMMFVADGLGINYTFTDVDGDYQIGVPGGFDYVMFVANGSYYMNMQPVSIMPGETMEINFTLEEITDPTDVTIKGWAKDEFGTAITEGHVLGIVNDPMGGDTPHYANMTTPAGDGYFEVNVIAGPNGGGAVLMDYPGYSMIENDTEDPLVGGETYWFNITVEPEPSIDDARLFGYVTDFDTGLPLENVMVSVEIENSYLSDRYSNYTFTDSDGNYELNVTNGSARLTFTKGGYMMKMYENLEVLPSDALQYDEALVATTCFIKGNVTDLSSDDPLVFANLFMMDGEGNYSSTITNATGYFELGCIDSIEIMAAAQMEGYSMNWTEVTLAPGEVLWHDFGLWPASSWIDGYVTDGFSTDPIEDAWVDVDSSLFNDWTNTNETGYYNISVVPGDYTVRVNADGYRTNESTVDVPDETAVTHSVELLPWDLPETCRLYGWVNETLGSGIEGAHVEIQLSDRSYYNGTSTDSAGYYEMSVPPLELMYGITAGQHSADYGTHDFEGLSEERLDFLLDQDLYNPNLTYSQDPVDNITWFNPTVIDAEMEDQNLESFSLTQYMFWKVEGTWEYYYAIDSMTTSFNPFNPSDDIAYTQIGDNYTIHEEWDATAGAGWLSDGVKDLYVLVYEQWWGPEMVYALRGNYTSSTIIDPVECTAIFDSDSGEIDMFWLDEGYDDVYPDDDPAALFEPLVMPIKFDVEDWTILDHSAWTLGAGEMDAATLTFQADPIVPSGDYKTVFSVGDFGWQGNGRITNFTVDNDPPVADIGGDWSSPVNTTVELNGAESDDNVGIVSFVWDFVYDGTPVQYTTEVAGHEFTELGIYVLTLTVTDGAGHVSTDTANLTITPDAPPVADPGPDMIVDEDTVAVFDGSASTDDNKDIIENYTWTIVELSVEMYGVSPEFTFDTPGLYTVELVVNDTIGQLSSPGSMTVTVEDVTDPTAIAGLDMSVPSDSIVTLNGSLSSDNVGVVIFNWTFTDDGSQVSLIGEAVDYAFTTVGIIVVTLTVEDAAGNNATDELMVTVLDATDPVADAGPDQIVEAGEEVTFDGTESSDNVLVVSWTWTFVDDGDDVTRTGESATYTFDNSGEFVVTLTVEDAAGNSDEDEVTIRVNSPPVADAGVAIAATAGEEVTFDGSDSSDDIGVENYTWTFAYDGEVETLYGVAPSFTFEIADNYTVTLVVEDASGLTDTDTVVVNVEEDDGIAEDESFLEEYWWLLLVIGVVVAGAAAAAAVMKSKKGAKGGSSTPPPEESEELPPPPNDGEL
ncbi:MAG: carboxypeptidase regulatory-like domain-containing protein [Candidatus Thermoplasmatota archaeon]|nr:carboxypeptidase regulatory-like domain-containing protein [Candidatus Thermoplasmatota archaeon]